MNIIVAVDQNYGIGTNQGLLYDLPNDLKYFKEMTMGKVVVMGEKTLFSLPNKKPLPNRTNIVLTNDNSLMVENAKVFNNMQVMLKYLATINPADVFIIGGAMVYEQLLPYCTFAYITHIYSAKPADKYFPNIENLPNWELQSISQKQSQNDTEFAFAVYKNNRPLPLV